MKELNAVFSILVLLLLSPLIGIAVSACTLLAFTLMPVWIAWRVFAEMFLKREPGLH